MKESIQLKRTHIEGTIHKRAPLRPAASIDNIYIANKTKVQVIINRVKRLMISEKYATISIHGMGPLIPRAIIIAQGSQRALENQVNLQMTTNTVTLFDDIIPDDMDLDIETQQRQISTIRIDIIAKPGLKNLQNGANMIDRRPSRNRKLKYP
ncbi:uncharacterized protein BX664DRAFT_344060 [Halteromyces radiatus]|uniref:uncharacterized protein n=1 Tax=Halteromyces radiatus TaxID=101107 RepID=UPI0022212892|nr:uncharacterized protein BX664DRAFT_344060 [Halteromyces radiatus]KAI8076834.1 hypothetical protein BX664DRAFT_344060 [Halteromyces radiatus]